MNDRSYDATSTPLATKVTTAPQQFQPLEEERKVETHSRLDILNGNNSTSLNFLEAEIITSVPDEIFANIEHVHKDIWNSAKLIRIRAKKEMLATEGRAVGGGTEHKGLQPRETL